MLPLREHALPGVPKPMELFSASCRTLDCGKTCTIGCIVPHSACQMDSSSLCIARALALTPQILLMDEPCSALDPIASGAVEDLITRLCGRYTIVIVTHNLAQARRIAHFAAFFWARGDAGWLVEFGHCRHIFEAPAHELTAAHTMGPRMKH